MHRSHIKIGSQLSAVGRSRLRVWAALACLVASGSAFGANLVTGTVNSGGGRSTSGNYVINANLGEIASRASTASANNWGGFMAQVAALATTPAAAFTLTPSAITVGELVTFTDVSAGTVSNRFWNFGDGTTANVADVSVSHTYNSVGTNTVTLIVSGPAGSSTNTQNNAVIVNNLPTVDTPIINPDGGIFTNFMQVTISCTTTGATIHYTTDGSTPTTNSAAYANAVAVSSSVIVKAVAFATGHNASAMASAEFVQFIPTVDTPTISPAGGTFTNTVSITLACATGGANIRYTTDGSAPTANSAIYNSAFTLTNSAAIKAAAFKGGYNASAMASADFVRFIPTAAAPVITPNGSLFTNSVSVTLTCGTPGAIIRFTTDGSEPAGGSPIYNGAFTVNNSATVKAFAYANGYNASAVTGADFVRFIPTAAAPVIAPNGGEFTNSVSVTLTCGTPGAIIRFTTDGSEPTGGSPIYNGVFTVSDTASVKAIAYANGYNASAVATTSFTIVATQPTVATPAIAPNGGTFTNSVQVTLSCGTLDATVRYTTDGSAPTSNSTAYVSTITFSNSATVRAVGYKDGYNPSSEAAASFTVVIPLPTVATPVIAPNGGSFTNPVAVTLSCATTNAAIRYTTDGSVPTSNSTAYIGILTLSNSATIRVVGYAAGFNPSDEAAAGFVISAAPVPCSYTLASTVTNFPANGGSGSFIVNTTGDCSWLANAGVAWLHTGSVGSGTNPVSFTVDANAGAARSGIISVGQLAFTVAQAGVSNATGLVASRTLPGCGYRPGISNMVTIAVVPLSNTQVYAVEEAPPAGWSVASIDNGGTWDSTNNLVRWGPFFDNSRRTVRYQVTPPPDQAGVVSFSGLASFDGSSLAVDGDSALGWCGSTTHPADTNGDFRIAINEVTGYGAAWKNGRSWPMPPNPIDINYVTRAGFLWKIGEVYHYDSGQSAPGCWNTGVQQRRRPSALGSTAVRDFTPGSYTATVAVKVTISVTPANGVSVYAIEDAPPSDWTITGIDNTGTNDSYTGKVKWGPFFDSTPRTLSYQATPPQGTSGVQSFAGTASFDGEGQSITGADTISQSLCSYNANSSSTNFTASGGLGNVSVSTTGTGCVWTADADVDWLSFPLAMTGTNAGTLRFAVAANTNADARTGHVIVQGVAVAVTQGGAGNAPTITTPSGLPDVVLGSVYSVTFAATGGTVPYTWAVAASSQIPVGLKLGKDGKLTGKPTKAGTQTFEIQVTGGLSSKKSFSLTVIDPAVTFTPLAGTYTGLILQSNTPTHASSGFIQIVLAKTGAFAANLTRAGVKTAFKGQFDLTGNATNSVGGVSVALHLDVTGASGPIPVCPDCRPITGTVTGTGFTSELLAELPGTGQVGTYTLVLRPADDTDATKPQGYGYATLIVSRGSGSLSGVFNDGTKLTVKAPVAQSGLWPLYVSLYKNAGACVGWVSFETNTTVAADVDWFAPAGNVYAPFSTRLLLDGSKYTSSSQLLTGTWDVTVNGGGVSNLVTEVSFENGKVIGANTFGLKLTLKTGLFTGSFKPLGAGKAISFSGLLLEEPVGGFGLFQNAGRTGSITLEPH